MTTLFISQPMGVRTLDDIYGERMDILRELATEFPDLYLIDNILSEEFCAENGKVGTLAEAIRLMSKADIIYFAQGWKRARGCQIEHQIARNYCPEKIIHD